MGSFAGHLLPGVLFVLQALIWFIQFLWTTHFNYSERRSPVKYCVETFAPIATTVSTEETESTPIAVSRTTSSDALPLTISIAAENPSFRSRGRTLLKALAWFVDAEPMMRIFVPLIGVIVEIYLAPWYNSWHDSEATSGDVGHITLYSAFVISGLLDVLRRDINNSSYWHTHGLAPSTIGGAFAIEGILFYTHAAMQHDLVESHAHSLLVLTVAGLVLVCALEVLHTEKRELYRVLRILLSFVQGFWFIALGVIIFVWDWNAQYVLPIDNPMERNMSALRQNMVVTVVYAWLVLIVAVGMYFTNLVCQRCSKPQCTYANVSVGEV